MAKPSSGSLSLSEPSNTYSHSALNGKVLRKGCYVLHVRHGFFSYDAANIQRENAKVKRKMIFLSNDALHKAPQNHPRPIPAPYFVQYLPILRSMLIQSKELDELCIRLLQITIGVRRGSWNAIDSTFGVLICINNYIPFRLSFSRWRSGRDRRGRGCRRWRFRRPSAAGAR